MFIIFIHFHFLNSFIGAEFHHHSNPVLFACSLTFQSPATPSSILLVCTAQHCIALTFVSTPFNCPILFLCVPQSFLSAVQLGSAQLSSVAQQSSQLTVHFDFCLIQFAFLRSLHLIHLSTAVLCFLVFLLLCSHCTSIEASDQ